MCGKVVPQARSQADLIYEFFHENEKALLTILEAIGKADTGITLHLDLWIQNVKKYDICMEE